MENPFRRNKSGRPEGTSVVGGKVIHYTCNAPDMDTLQQQGIQAVGDKFGIDPREVVIIPKELFDIEGRPVDTAQAERILANLRRTT